MLIKSGCGTIPIQHEHFGSIALSRESQEHLTQSDMLKNKHVAIIGAGPSGLAAAKQLCKQGIKTTVYERSKHVGGLARSFTLWGKVVDLGPHRFFTKSNKVIQFWNEVLGDDVIKVNRKTRIFYRGKFISYPLRLIDTCKALGTLESIRCVLSYLNRSSALADRADKESLETWLISRFGKRLYEHFFEGYNFKLWGVGCNYIEADFAAQRIRGLSLPQAIKSSLGFRGDAKRTLADEFEYPIHGAGMLYEKVTESLTKQGIEVLLGNGIKELRFSHSNGAVALLLEDGSEHVFDHVISSMPLNQLVSAVADAPGEVIKASSELRYRNSILVYLKVDKDHLFDDQWIYVHDTRIQLGRITNFRNWLTGDYAEGEGTILCCEYWCEFGGSLWSLSDNELIALAKTDLDVAGFADGTLVSNGHVERIPKSYPMYFRGYKKRVETISKWIDKLPNVTAIGRSGTHSYNNQDHSILMGILAAENISQMAHHEIWNVNSDSEYQEA